MKTICEKLNKYNEPQLKFGYKKIHITIFFSAMFIKKN